MSKIGKRYNLFSAGYKKTNDLYSYIKENNINVFENKEEYYDLNNQKYVGTLLFANKDSEVIKGLEQYLDTNFNSRLGQTIDTNFSIDSHYEELKELNGLKQAAETSVSLNVIGSSSLDGENLYKFQSSLEYNFLIKNYEDYITNQTPETALPYFYETLSGFIDNQNYDKFVGTTFFEVPNQIISSSARPELITNVVASYVQLQSGKQQIDKYLKLFEPYKEQFPFYTDIKFDTHPKSKNNITDILHKRDYYTDLLSNIVSFYNESSLFYKLNPNDIENSILTKELNINRYLNNLLDNSAINDFSFIFDINFVIDGKARSFMDVLKGKKEYSEIAGYHLKKYDGFTLIQEWYIPNVNDEGYNFIDTQVKYDKEYTYKLDLIVLSFSTLYSFTNITRTEKGIIVEYENIPLIKLFVLDKISNSQNTLGASYTNRLLDYPPIEPEIDIIPYIRNANTIKLNLNTSIGKKTVPAITFSATELENVNKLKDSQNKNVSDSLLTFQSDEPSELFEIYKLDFRPYSYDDFFNTTPIVVTTNQSSAGSLEDTIESNKKYYYVARSIDYHGHYSNPTPIYEVEILNENGLVIPITNVVDFAKKENNVDQNKSLKKYLKIQPAIRHRIFNAEKISNNEVQLGNDEIKPWNKTFKIRLTSKSTGKKIDINFKFKYNKPT
jgi:hypothetical protein